MNKKKMALAGFAIIALAALTGLFFYFQSQKNPLPAPALLEESKPAAGETKASAKEEAISPLRLDYTINNFGPGSATLSYFIENKFACDDRPAYLGLMKIGANNQNTQPQYAKFSIFADNGQMAVSQWEGENGMAFDNAKSKYNDLDLPLMLSGIFAYAGKNFNSAEYREAKTPILLKNVFTGQSTGDYSIIPMGDDTVNGIACKKFKIVVKSNTTDGYFTGCVAQKIGDINLPFVVSMAFENKQGPSWELTNFSNESSQIPWIPQCLSPVVCANVAQPAQTEKIACNSRGGQIETNYDQQGCVTEYKCMTQTEIAKAAIAGMQNPDCAVNQKILDKIVQCRKNNQPNFDPAGYDNAGCLTGIANCR